jgi:hypothetical protein
MAIAETLPIAPADLLIDESNPRIAQPNAGQHKALRALAEHLSNKPKGSSKLQALAADIVEHGLDPSNLSIVMPQTGHAGRYVVLEGNRRLAALRVLENPELVVEAVPAKVLTQLRKLSKDYQDNPVESVPCLVVKDRGEAAHWIQLRHTGENAGAGIVPWGSDDASRFRDRSGVGEPHTQALDFLMDRGDLTPDIRRKVPATTFKRLIEAPPVRARMGLELQNRVLYALAKEDRIAKALMHVVNDLLSGSTRVGDVYTKEQRAAYAAKLPASVVVTPTVPSGRGTPLKGTAPAATKPPGHVQRVAKQRDRLIPKDCALGIPAGRVANIERELRRLSLEDHTNAVSVLFRVFLELSVDVYIEANFGVLPEDDRTPLHKKITSVLTDLLSRKKIAPKQATAVRTLCVKDSFLAPSISLMNQYVHNPHVFPAPGDLRSHWDNLQPFAMAIWST